MECEVIYLIYFYFVTCPFFKVTSEQKLEKQKSLSDCKECSISVKVSRAGEFKKSYLLKIALFFADDQIKMIHLRWKVMQHDCCPC